METTAQKPCSVHSSCFGDRAECDGDVGYEIAAPVFIQTANGYTLCQRHADSWRAGGNTVAMFPMDAEDIAQATAEGWDGQCSDCIDKADSEALEVSRRDRRRRSSMTPERADARGSVMRRSTRATRTCLLRASEAQRPGSSHLQAQGCLLSIAHYTLFGPEWSDHVDSELPPLLGMAEVAAYLGISRQRIHVLRKEGRFPEPFVSLKCGDVWTAQAMRS